MSTSSPKRIGIAVVEHDGCYLIGTRGPDSPLPGYAEFPGGKCQPDESAEDCAVRETLEESGLNIIIERLLLRREFSYPHATVDLHFFLCHPIDQRSVSDDHQGFRWIPASELAALKFPEANEPLVNILTTN
jgi:mutator protein MutT